MSGMIKLNTHSETNPPCAPLGKTAGNCEARREVTPMIRRPAASLPPIAATVMIIVFSAISARAGLRFERTSVDLQPEVGKTKLTGVFAFKNDGDRPVTILAIKSSCGCTTATLEKRVYQSGETGEIRVSYSPGSETGERQKTVEVLSDDAKLPMIALELRATIEPAFKIGNRVASWRMGDATKPRAIKIEVSRREPLELTSALCSSDKVEATLLPIEAGRKYKLTVIPKSTADPIEGAHHGPWTGRELANAAGCCPGPVSSDLPRTDSAIHAGTAGW
jgi:Protein of unknown function (DUF1573)